MVVELTAHGDELRAENLEGAWVEFAAVLRFAAQHREAFDIAVVEDLGDFGFSVGEAEIGFVEYQRAAEAIEQMKDRRDAGSTTCKNRCPTDRADGEEKTRLASSVFTMEAQIWQFVEAVVHPAEQNVMCRD